MCVCLLYNQWVPPPNMIIHSTCGFINNLWKQADSPTPDSPTPDSPTPDSPTPDSPTPDSPTPDTPTIDSPTQFTVIGRIIEVHVR